jgi:hypothetical protein
MAVYRFVLVAVSAGSIVIHFNVLEYCLSHLFPGDESLPMNCLHLDRMKEALGTGIVIAVAFAAHAANQAAATRMYNNLGGMSRRYRAIFRTSHTSGAVMRPDIAQPTTKQVNDSCLIEPAFRVNTRKWPSLPVCVR